MTETVDAVVVGAGHNGLVAAVLLARAGWDVVVCERNEEPGGAVRTAELTEPGFRHDLFATNLNLFAGSPFHAELGDDLARHGLELVVADHAFASVFPDGRLLGVTTDPAATRSSLERVSAGDADAWDALAARFGAVAPHLFPLLGAAVPSWALVRTLARGSRALGRSWLPELARLFVQSPREFAEEHFESREVQALVAAWGMHLDFPPAMSGGALFPFLESMASAANGMALGRGGAASMITALVGLLEEAGGSLRCGTPVDRILVETGRNGGGLADRDRLVGPGRRAGGVAAARGSRGAGKRGRAVGVELASGERIAARRAVIANVVPGVLDRLVPADQLSERFGQGLQRYRHGPGTFMLHLAIDDLPDWRAGAEARRYSYIHIGPYMEDMDLAYVRAVAGLLPERPLLVVGQPTTVDPSRAPGGKHVLWVQVRMVPGEIRGDALGRIVATSWDEAKAPFAERVLDILEEYAPGTRGKIRSQAALAPPDLEAANANLVGGDSLGGSHHLMQQLFLRPVPGWSRYRTPVDRLYLCGAATWPGAGVGAGSGYLLATSLTKGRPLRRP